MNRRWIRYTSDEIAWLEANAKLPRAEFHAAFVEKFRRSDVKAEHLVGLRKRKGWKTGRDGRFPKGIVPPNKGRFGVWAPGSEKGWFNKGERRGRAAAKYKPVGTERVGKGGYLERKINDDLPFQRRWRFVHLIRWEEINGAVPQGYALKCLDGDRLNTDPANWELISRALLPRLNGGNGKARGRIAYDDAPAELKPVLLTIAKVEQRVREVSRGATNKARSTPPAKAD